MILKKIPVSVGHCDDCGTALKTELVTTTFKGFLVSRRTVLYCPNPNCPKEVS